MPQFALLGIASGLVTGLVIVAFRLAIEWPLAFLTGGDPENFEALKTSYVLVLPIVGAILLIPFFQLFAEPDRRVGVVHVMERLARHQGHLPLKNAIIQFVSGVIALASGQSGGREGPAIHLGAAGSSLIGQWLKLPNNSVRVLVGCGAAAAIAASFNTPIAGVIFSMEVIVMEYTIAGFIPVILAAVVAALVTQLVFGSATAFDVPPVSMESLLDLPVLVLEGIFVGAIAAVFVRSLFLFHRWSPSSPATRLMLVGLVTGLLAMIAPQIMGVGYDTVNSALIGDLSIIVLLLAFVLKIIASAMALGMGMPIGIIGPTLFIGAMAGGIFAVSTRSMEAGLSADAFYVMLGMGAMMGAVLQAPLAALMAVLELTGNPNIILPAMLVIIIANLTASQVFGLKSVFIMQMQIQGLEFRQNPLSQALNRASVASIMERNFARVDRELSVDEARQIVRDRNNWLLVDGSQGPSFILRSEDLENYLTPETEGTVDLVEIPATRKDVTGIYLQATLGEALDALNQSGVQALFVNRISAPLMNSPVGILTREDIETYYRS